MKDPIRFFAAFLFVFSYPAAVPQSSPSTAPQPQNPLLDQLRQSVKIQFRDTVEFHVHQRVIVTATDSRGHVRKHITADSETIWQGYNPHNRKRTVADITLTPSQLFSTIIRGRWRLFVNGNVWITLPIDMILGERAIHHGFSTEQTDNPESLAARITFPKTCPAFAMSRPQFFLPDMFCGTNKFQFAAGDLALQSFTFEAAGLPARIKVKPWNNCLLHRYYAEVEYHKVMLPNSTDPYVVPRRVTNILEADKGRIEIVTIYEPNELPGNYRWVSPNELASAPASTR